MDDFLQVFEVAQKAFDASEAAKFERFERLKLRSHDPDLNNPSKSTENVDPFGDLTKYLQSRKGRRWRTRQPPGTSKPAHPERDILFKTSDPERNPILKQSRRLENEHQPVTGHVSRSVEELQDCAGLVNLFLLNSNPSYTFTGEIIIESREAAVATVERIDSPKRPNLLVLWADGSTCRLKTKLGKPRSKPICSGAAVVHRSAESRDTWIERGYHMPDLQDSSRAELIAVAEALDIAVATMCNAHSPFSEVHIFSDAASVLQSIERLRGKRLPRSLLIKDVALGKLITRSQSLAQDGFDVHLHWVPGHSGILGNEKADRVARRAAQFPTWCLHQWQVLSVLETDERKMERAIAERYWGKLDPGSAKAGGFLNRGNSAERFRTSISAPAPESTATHVPQPRDDSTTEFKDLG